MAADLNVHCLAFVGFISLTIAADGRRHELALTCILSDSFLQPSQLVAVDLNLHRFACCRIRFSQGGSVKVESRLRHHVST